MRCVTCVAVRSMIATRALAVQARRVLSTRSCRASHTLAAAHAEHWLARAFSTPVMSSTGSLSLAPSSSSAAGAVPSLSPASSAKFFWLDLEMTGLDDSVDRILEVAVVITDSAWQPLGRYQAVVRQPPEALAAMSAFVRQMHTATGLLQRLDTEGKAEAAVEAELLQLLDAVYAAGEKVLLCGNSVHVDRLFLRRYWPLLERRLHYRILDVSSWKEVFASLYDTWWEKKNRHSAADDVEESIAELRYYLSFLDKDKLRREGGKGSAT